MNFGTLESLIKFVKQEYEPDIPKFKELEKVQEEEVELKEISIEFDQKNMTYRCFFMFEYLD